MSPFSDNRDFIDALACAWGGRVVAYEPLPLVEKGRWFLRRAYSLPFGLYGGFVQEPDYDLVRSMSMKYIRLAIVDFHNRLEPDKVPYMNPRTLTTHVLRIPSSMQEYLSSLRKKRRRSLQNMLNRMRKLDVGISLSRDWMDDFYDIYRAATRSRPLSPDSIRCLMKFSFLVSAVRRGRFLGGVLVLRVGDYAMLWLAGWRRHMQMSEYLYYSAIEVAMDMGARWMDFGASHAEGVMRFKESMGGVPHHYRVLESRKI